MNAESDPEKASVFRGGSNTPGLIPARMLNEFTYCPRLFYLEWVEGEFEESADVVEGQEVHRNVRTGRDGFPRRDSGTDVEVAHARSITLSGERVGLIASIDVIEAEGDRVVPVDYKRGEVPDVPEGAWEADRVQLCAQGLILRENGYNCPDGAVFYAGSRKRVVVPFTETLVRRTLELVDEARKTASLDQAPPPLLDSPKCPRCSLVGICLPDETNILIGPSQGESDGAEARRLFPARDTRLPLYVQEQGSTVGKRGEVLDVRRREGSREEVRLIEVSQLCVYGNVMITPQALHALCRTGVAVCHFSYGGWFYGLTTGMSHKNVELRLRQFRVAEDAGLSTVLARRFVEGKIRNCRTLLRRNCEDAPASALRQLAKLERLASEAQSLDVLLGIEGSAGRLYFSLFGGMLKNGKGEGLSFDFESRNKRPPHDPINAMLSFLYSLLAKDLAVTLLAVGFDPYLGFYHQPRYGRPALALDLMEEFRPLVADSVVLTLVNNGEVRQKEFITRGPATAMMPECRKTVIHGYERRLDSLVTHPVFRYSISYRRVFEVQARLLGRYLAGEVESYAPFCTR